MQDAAPGSQNKENRLATGFKRVFLTFVVTLFFCDIAIYLSLAVSPRLEPQYWIGVLVMLTGLLAWFSRDTRWEVFHTEVFLWCVLFFVLTLIFYTTVPVSYVEQLKERIRDVVLLTTLLAVFLTLQDELVFVRKLVLLVVVLGVVVNVIGLFNRGFLKPLGVATSSQPGGFYINPNESGIALILGLLLSVSILPHRWRMPYALIVLLGVAATFSREAVLGWLIVVIGLTLWGGIKYKSLMTYLLVVILCAALIIVLANFTHVFRPYISNFYHLQIERFSWFVGGSGAAGSNEMRIKVLKAGWALFLAHPLTGAGIGSTYHWSLPVSTHNMYLLYMDDYGIIGFFLYPLLIWCMVRGAVGETRKLAWTMAIFLLYWGFFDHNIVQNYYSLFAISMTAAMARISTTQTAVRAEPVPVEPVCS